MTRVLLGMLGGAALLALVMYVWMRGDDACLGRCGPGTKCDDHRCVAAAEAKPAAAPAKERRRRPYKGGELAGAQPELHLSPGDEKMVSQGDALGRPEHIDLSKPDDPNAKELGEDELDQKLRNHGGIRQCISDAIGDWPLETAKVVVGLRIEKDGRVSKVRVEAPALLQRNGLHRCIRNVLATVRFSNSGGATVATYDYSI
jgi:hypothetical protein